MNRKWACILMVSGLAGASLCHAAVTPNSNEIDEVVVNGTPLHELRAAVLAAEERFYERYNELNKVKDFDIECVVAPPTGSRLNRRTCRTILQLNAQADQGREFVQMVRDLGDGVTGVPPSTDPDAAFLWRYQEYKENVLYLLKMNPDLRRLVHDREEAAKRYDSERVRRFKERWFAF